METLSEMEIKQIKMFGCTTAQIKKDVEDVRNIKMFVMGMLSDVQEMATGGYYNNDSVIESVRVNLNKAKYIIDNFMVKA